MQLNSLFLRTDLDTEDLGKGRNPEHTQRPVSFRVGVLRAPRGRKKEVQIYRLDPFAPCFCF